MEGLNVILHLFVVDVDLVTTDLEKVLHRSGVFCVQHAFLVCEVCQSVPGKSFFGMFVNVFLFTKEG